MSIIKIDINDPALWGTIGEEEDKPIVPESLKRTDYQVERARINRIRNQSPKMREAVINHNKTRVGPKHPNFGKTGEGVTFYGHTHDNSNKAAMTHKGEKNGMYGRHLTGEQNGFYGETHTDEVKQLLQEKALNRTKDHHCEHCNGDFTAQAYNQHHGDYCEHNPNRIIKERKKMAKEICPHCGTEAAPKAFARLHGDNCKKKK